MTLKERKADLEGMRAEGRPMNNASEPIMMLSGFMPSQVVPPPTRPENDDQLIEFEQALLSLSLIPNISNPCMKRTMMVGPKKFVGKIPNS